MAIIGDTIRVEADFCDWQDNPVDLTDISITVYDKDKSQIETITTNIDNPSVGTYQYDYTIPDGDGYIAVEFRGLLGGKPKVIRKKVAREWATT